MVECHIERGGLEGFCHPLYPAQRVDASSTELSRSPIVLAPSGRGAFTTADAIPSTDVAGDDRVLRDGQASRDTSGRDDDECLAVLAHELHAPLASMQVMIELLGADQPLSPEDLGELVQRLHRGVTWMNTIVENMGTWTAIRDGRLTLNRTGVVVTDWIAAALTLVHPILARKQQSVQVTCPSPAPVVYGDAQRLTQVIINLLVNASRYGSWADTIELAVVAASRQVTITVSDHGIGIPEGEQERIFQHSVRASNASDVVEEGQGLGLHIVQSLVYLHGGEIGVCSTAGAGTTFWLTLPTFTAVDALGVVEAQSASSLNGR